MGQRGSIRRVFPGGNTGYGFHSFYHYMIKPDATRIFCIKGGPGVGKSTFMKSIGEHFQNQGYDIEYHCCSSDNGSLDGVVIPALEVALLDGTAPHVVDPKNPGAVDEIIHLGDNWDESKLRENKEAILKTNARVGRLFAIAYASIREARVIIEEWESYVTESQNFGAVNNLTKEILQKTFVNTSEDYSATPQNRHLFASAITPQGPQTHFPSILQGIKTVVSLEGVPGSGKSTLINSIYQAAQQRGLYCEVYHRPIEPKKLDGVVIPALKSAVVNFGLPFAFSPSEIPGAKEVISYDLSNYLDCQIYNKYAVEVDAATARCRSAFNRGAQYISLAKAEHDVMEEYYIPAMDFEAINARRDEIIKRIEQYAEEFK